MHQKIKTCDRCAFSLKCCLFYWSMTRIMFTITVPLKGKDMVCFQPRRTLPLGDRQENNIHSFVHCQTMRRGQSPFILVRAESVHPCQGKVRSSLSYKSGFIAYCKQPGRNGGSILFRQKILLISALFSILNLLWKKIIKNL